MREQTLVDIRLKAAVAGLMLPIFVATGPALGEGEFCTEIVSLMKLGSLRNFRSIRGDYDAELESYATSRSLPNATDCYIQKDQDREDYICEWNFGSDKQAANAAFRTMADAVSACSLHAHTRDRTSSHRSFDVQSRLYFLGRREGIIDMRVALHHNLRRGNYTLYFEVQSHD